MADIRIRRTHSLGPVEARKIAGAWTEQVETRFAMVCTVTTGETRDIVAFTRSGVDGRLIVAADHFDLNATLGFFLGPFSKTIESEIEKRLDALLAKGAPN